MKNILLIGGEGYIGNVLSIKLLSSNYNVTSFDNFLYGNNHCVLNKMNYPRYKFIFGDMVNRDEMVKALKNIDTVILLAGLVGDPITKKYPLESAIINDNGVRTVIDLCVEKNINQLIFVSTCSNYGLIKNDEFADEDYLLDPLSLYAKSKVKAEKHILSLRGKTGMNPTILRFATAFGLSMRMRFDLTISEFTKELTLGNELLVYDAHTWRPYCHVQDFARLIQLVIEAPQEKVSFEVFNAGGDINNATKQMIVDNILEIIPDGKIIYKDHGTDPRNYRVSFKKVKKALGFETKFTINDGISELINKLNNHVFDNVNPKNNFYANYEINYSVSQ